MVFFKWNGEHLGEISGFVSKYHVYPYGVVAIMIDGTKAFCNKYVDPIPLIADELKKVFGLPKIGRHICTILGKSVLLSRTTGGETQFSGESLGGDDFIHMIRRSYLFRAILGLTKNFDSSLAIINRGGIISATSYYETKISYLSVGSRGSVISKRAVEKWFGNQENVFITLQQMIKNKYEMRQEIYSIIKRIDGKWISWGYQIMKKIDEENF